VKFGVHVKHSEMNIYILYIYTIYNIYIYYTIL
jgi:hypothetical protein